MSAGTSIEWCDATINFWWGCHKVSPACTHCYAETWAKRMGKKQFGFPIRWGKDTQRGIRVADAFEEAMQLNRRAERTGKRLRVFVNSMSDTFDEAVPIEALASLLSTIHACPHLNFLLLTKRPENWKPRMQAAADHGFLGERAHATRGWIEHWLKGNPWGNVWIGTTVEDQTRADERIPALLQIPAKVRFLSCEPMLGPVDISFGLPWTKPLRARVNGIKNAGLRDIATAMLDRDDEGPMVNWVIAGGESGPGARPMHPDWPRSLRDQCVASGVPFLFKQHGEWMARSQWLRTPSITLAELKKDPHGSVMRRGGTIDETLGHACSTNDDDSAIKRVGKKSAGRLLDGREWNEFPEVSR